jgi:hypothetical protein
MNDVLNNPHTKDAIYQDAIKCLGTYSFTATFSLDNQTLEQFKHVPGLISFLCVLRRGSEVIGEGRGVGKLSSVNKYIERTLVYSRNASFLDAVTRSIKMFDTFPIVNQMKDGNSVTEEDKQISIIENITPISGTKISEKQRTYLIGLVEKRVIDKEERHRWQNKINNFSKNQASQAIKSFI